MANMRLVVLHAIALERSAPGTKQTCRIWLTLEATRVSDKGGLLRMPIKIIHSSDVGSRLWWRGVPQTRSMRTTPLEATSDQGETATDEGGANLANRPLSVYIQRSFTADLFHRPVFIAVDGF